MKVLLNTEKSLQFFFHIFGNNIELIEGLRIRNFEPTSLIGAGAFGAVFKVENSNTNYAIKLVKYKGEFNNTFQNVISFIFRRSYK